jgi:hypothetical protein
MEGNLPDQDSLVETSRVIVCGFHCFQEKISTSLDRRMCTDSNLS